MRKNITSEISLGAWKSIVNAGILLPGTHHSARRMCLKSWHLLQVQPIANLSKIHTKLNVIIQISYPASLFTMLMGFSHHEFYYSHPFARNKQSVHIVSFPAHAFMNVILSDTSQYNHSIRFVILNYLRSLYDGYIYIHICLNFTSSTKGLNRLTEASYPCQISAFSLSLTPRLFFFFSFLFYCSNEMRQMVKHPRAGDWISVTHHHGNTLREQESRRVRGNPETHSRNHRRKL